MKKIVLFFLILVSLASSYIFFRPVHEETDISVEVAELPAHTRMRENNEISRDALVDWYVGSVDMADRTSVRPGRGVSPLSAKRDRPESVRHDAAPPLEPVRSYYDSGAIREEAFFKNGVPDGPARWYYESGVLEQEVTFRSGKREGFLRTYYESGQLREEVYYHRDRPEGTARWFYEDGTLMQETEFSGGNRHGITRTYREDGVRQAEWLYENGEIVEESKVFRIDTI